MPKWIVSLMMSTDDNDPTIPRRVFAALVLSIVILLVGAMTVRSLPILFESLFRGTDTATAHESVEPR